jgi:hypothetical protein
MPNPQPRGRLAAAGSFPPGSPRTPRRRTACGGPRSSSRAGASTPPRGRSTATSSSPSSRHGLRRGPAGRVFAGDTFVVPTWRSPSTCPGVDGAERAERMAATSPTATRRAARGRGRHVAAGGLPADLRRRRRRPPGVRPASRGNGSPADCRRPAPRARPRQRPPALLVDFTGQAAQERRCRGPRTRLAGGRTFALLATRPKERGPVLRRAPEGPLELPAGDRRLEALGAAGARSRPRARPTTLQELDRSSPRPSTSTGAIVNQAQPQERLEPGAQVKRVSRSVETRPS